MHGRRRTRLLTLAATVVVLSTPGAAVAAGAQPFVHGLDGGSGSTIGPDGQLYVTEPISGEVTRINRTTGATQVVADCLPDRVIEGIGGAMDVAFAGGRMYVLTALVSPDVGGTGTTGLYRVDGRHDCEVVADIGQWNIDHPPTGFDFFVASGLPYAMERWGTGFLVTDGHLNRVLKVGTDGSIHRALRLGNVVPTGLERSGTDVLVALAGPVPHLPRDGKVIAFQPGSADTRVIASGGRLLVDVEEGAHCVYALSQGVLPDGAPPGSPAAPDTGRLMRAESHDLITVASGLDRPTSMEVVGSWVYVVGYAGDVWRIRVA